MNVNSVKKCQLFKMCYIFAQNMQKYPVLQSETVKEKLCKFKNTEKGLNRCDHELYNVSKVF